MMQRRGFLGAILAAGFAPAAVGSGVLMPVRSIATPFPSFVFHQHGVAGAEQIGALWHYYPDAAPHEVTALRRHAERELRVYGYGQGAGSLVHIAGGPYPPQPGFVGWRAHDNHDGAGQRYVMLNGSVRWMERAT